MLFARRCVRRTDVSVVARPGAAARTPVPAAGKKPGDRAYVPCALLCPSCEYELKRYRATPPGSLRKAYRRTVAVLQYCSPGRVDTQKHDKTSLVVTTCDPSLRLKFRTSSPCGTALQRSQIILYLDQRVGTSESQSDSRTRRTATPDIARQHISVTSAELPCFSSALASYAPYLVRRFA